MIIITGDANFGSYETSLNKPKTKTQSVPPSLSQKALEIITKNLFSSL
jgi:hypothetical protein